MKLKHISIGNWKITLFLSFINFVIVLIIAYFFYKSCVFALTYPIINILLLRIESSYLVEQKKYRIQNEFLQFLVSIDSSIRAGYSLENAVYTSIEDIKSMFGVKSIMYKNLIVIANSISVNVPVEKAFSDFGKKAGISCINDFCDIINLTYRSNGAIASVLHSTIQTITMSIETKREIHSLTSAKRFEVAIMILMPLIIIIYLKLFSSNFLNPLYEGFAGRSIMTFCLFIYSLSMYIAYKLVHSLT